MKSVKLLLKHPQQDVELIILRTCMDLLAAKKTAADAEARVLEQEIH